MKIICFRGAGGTGKSHIIRKIFTEVYTEYIKIFHPKVREFSLFFKINESKIGICSLGDREKDLDNYLRPLKEKNCDIIICACHPEGSKTDNYIKKLFENQKIKFIECLDVGNNKHKQESYWSKKVKEFKVNMGINQ